MVYYFCSPAKSLPQTERSKLIVHETERLLLKTWEFTDFDTFADIARNPDVMRYIAEGEPWADSRIGWFMGLQNAYQLSLGYCNWKLINRENDELIGFCGIAPLASVEATEIGWWLKPSCWGQGYAFEAAEQVLSAAFNEHSIDKLVARVYDINNRSVSLIKRLGMKYDRLLTSTTVGDVLLFRAEPKLIATLKKELLTST